MSAGEASKGIEVAVLTPPGGGGIAVIGVRGPGAGDRVRRIFRPPSGREPAVKEPGTLRYGHILDGDQVIDEVLVRCVRRGPGPELLEINCHGGAVPAAGIVRLLVGQGAREVRPESFSASDAGGCGTDTIRRAAWRLLPRAETRLAVRVLCDQWNGALSDAIRGVRSSKSGAVRALRRLAASGEFGCALTVPRRVALVGEPNAGKSTLFNALVGHTRTIVSPVPGTTRDFVNEFIALGGYPVELVDTAGLRQRGGLLEMKGVERSWRVVSEADLVVFVVDGSVSCSAEEADHLWSLTSRELIVAVNKSDLPGCRGADEPYSGLPSVPVSGLTGEGLTELERAIRSRFPDPDRFPPGSPVAFTAEQVETLDRAAALCADGDAAGVGALLALLLK
jgi:tRNA modification GTPase